MRVTVFQSAKAKNDPDPYKMYYLDDVHWLNYNNLFSIYFGYSTKYFHNKWKHAYITMVHKTSKRKGNTKHYCSICLLTLFSKIFELPKLL